MPASHSPIIHDRVIDELREQVVNELAHHLAWLPLKNALEGNCPVVTWFTNLPTSGIRQFFFEPGLASYDPHDLDRVRYFYPFIGDVLAPMILKGEIQDGSVPGSYDDRKLRWSNLGLEECLELDPSTLTLAVGPTWFQQCQRDIHRAPIDALKLMLEGLTHHADPYAYFARGLGVVVIPVAREGTLFIGKRTRTTDYDRSLCFVSGWATFSTDLGSIDPLRELERELQEEIHLGAPINREQTRFLGLAGHPLTSEVDLVFLTQTDLSEEHFQRGCWPEHEAWYPIHNCNEADQLLAHGSIHGRDEQFDLMFSSRFALECLINHYWPQ